MRLLISRIALTSALGFSRMGIHRQSTHRNLQVIQTPFEMILNPFTQNDFGQGKSNALACRPSF